MAEKSNCPEALEKLFEYLDGELEELDQETVARHFEACRRCYPRLRFERSFMDALQRVSAGKQAPPALRRRVVEVLRGEGLDCG